MYVMRKYHKKMILDLLKTLNQVNSEIKKLFIKKDFQSVMNLLADCQDCAGAIISMIEQSEGEDAVTLPYIEDYYKLLFEISVNITDSFELIKKLRKQTDLIESSIRNDIKGNKLEIAFFPYKVNVFDCLESIWLAANEDPDCDAYVVPIPYYDRNPDGTFGQMHYEGNSYPDNIPIVDWKQYNVAERHPDIIYIHNPYDEYNYVTSVVPSHYSHELKKHTDMLVYIPYFVTSGYVAEHYCTTSVAIHADKIIVQSEQVANKYKSYSNNPKKVLNLGSPKIDKIINTKAKDIDIPQEWTNLIGNKKVILYNTHIRNIILNNLDFLYKLENVFNTFSKRNDVVLWWRPHPLSTATAKSMNPNFLSAYNSLVMQYRKSKIGIYDDTNDLTRALVITDAYYGDWSSLVPMYNATGKPVLIENISLKSVESKENELKISCWDFDVKDNVMWFVPNNINCIFTMDLDTNQVKLIAEIPNNYIFTNNEFSSIKVVNNYIILTPLNNKIVRYDISNDKFDSIDIGTLRQKFSDSYVYNNNIYMLPRMSNYFIKYDVNKNCIYQNHKICNDLDKLKSDTGNFYFWKCFVINDDYLIAVSHVGNVLLKYNLKTDKYSLQRVGNTKNQYMNISYDGENYWLVSAKGNIVKWNEKNGAINEINIEVTNFISMMDFNFSCSVIFDDYLYLFPSQSNMILKVNIHTNEVKCVANMNARSEVHGLHFTLHKYLSAKKVGNYIYAFSNYENTLQKINPKTDEIENIPFVLSDEDYAKIMNKEIFSSSDNSKLPPYQVAENSIMTLEFFLDRLVKENINTDNISFDSVSEIFVNSDGTCGEKIHKQISKEVLKKSE